MRKTLVFCATSSYLISGNRGSKGSILTFYKLVVSNFVNIYFHASLFAFILVIKIIKIVI
jgi:hypothetical protein